MQIGPDFRAFVALLNAAGVRYLLVGGYAVIHHGYPRTTGDMDIWVDPELANATKLVEVIREFSYLPAGIDVHDFTAEGLVFQIGVVPNRIDVLTSVDGLRFEEAYPVRESFTVDGTEFQVVNLNDLRTNKKATARLKDLADLEELPPA